MFNLDLLHQLCAEKKIHHSVHQLQLATPKLKTSEGVITLKVMVVPLF